MLYNKLNKLHLSMIGKPPRGIYLWAIIVILQSEHCIPYADYSLIQIPGTSNFVVTYKLQYYSIFILVNVII